MDSSVEKKSKLILETNPIWKGLATLALPVFLANILKTLHDIVDGIFLGQIPDEQIATSMQSAVALTWPIFFVFISFGMGLSVAGNALVGQYMGNREFDNAKKYATNTIYLSIILGVLFTAVAFTLAPVILKAMGVEGSDLTYAILYLRIRSFELPILFLSYAYQAIRRSTGDTVTPVLISSFAIIINIILTPVLILVFNMGIKGAALSTLVAHIVMLPLLLYYLINAKNGIKVSFNIKFVNIPSINKILSISIPASIGQSIQAVGFVILNSLIYSFGNTVTTAFYIGNRINSLVMFPVSSITAIVAVYVAQNIGAGNIKRAKSSVKQGMLMSVAIMIIGVLVLLPFRNFFVNLFSHDQNTIALAVEYMIFIGISLPLMAVFQTFLSTFQGSGDTRFTLYLAVIRLWIFRLPFVVLTMKFTELGPVGIWYSMLASNLFASLVGLLLYSKVKFMPKVMMTRNLKEAI